MREGSVESGRDARCCPLVRGLLGAGVAGGRHQEEEAVGAERHGRPQLVTPYVPPRDELERQLASIWEQLRATAKIGILMWGGGPADRLGPAGHGLLFQGMGCCFGLLNRRYSVWIGDDYDRDRVLVRIRPIENSREPPHLAARWSVHPGPRSSAGQRLSARPATKDNSP